MGVTQGELSSVVYPQCSRFSSSSKVTPWWGGQLNLLGCGVRGYPTYITLSHSIIHYFFREMVLGNHSLSVETPSAGLLLSFFVGLDCEKVLTHNLGKLASWYQVC